MTGFWTPILKLMSRLLFAWGRALYETAPMALQSYLRWAQEPLFVTADELLQNPTAAHFQGKSLNVDVGEASCLHYQFKLPASAVAELRRAIALEAERVLPVHISKLTTAYAVGDHGKEDEVISVDLYAARTKLIDRLREASVGADLTLNAILPTREAVQQVSFPLDEVKSRKRRNVALSLVSAATLLGLISLIPSLYLSRVENALANTAQQIQAARSATKQVASLQNEMRERKNISDAIIAAVRGQRMTELLEVLSSASPDHIVLEAFRIDRSRLSISGVASNPESWAIDLEKVAAFEDVILVSARGSDQDELQRFEMRMSVSWPSLKETVQ